ncbi:MAG: phage tail protein [Muribaculaceae bacterium]|nr:phage tail protein [Muribaculaceae bacterium]
MAEEIKEAEYINGSDILVNVGGKAVGHSTTHTVTMNSETKDRAVKPVASAGKSAGMWKKKGVTGLSISIKADGLQVYRESENGYEACAALWGKGQSVPVECYHRGEANPYIKGNFIIESIEETAPAQDDSTYSISLSNDGEPEIYPGKEETSDDTDGE